MATAEDREEKDTIDIQFVDDDNVSESFTPLRTGLRSRAKRIYDYGALATPCDDRRFRYSEVVTLESSSDEEEEIVRPTGEAILSQTPVSSHHVFSFQKIKRKSALAVAASEAIHVKTPEKSLQHKMPKSAPAKTRTKKKTNEKKSKVQTSEKPKMNLKRRDSRYERHLLNDMNNGEESYSGDSDASSAEDINEKKIETSARACRIEINANDENNNLGEMLDEYFLAHDETNCLTSDRTLSQLSTPRMNQETLSSILKSNVGGHQDQRRQLYVDYRTYFEKWAFQLRNGFNLLLHGLGSKRCIIDQFRDVMLSKFIQLVVNGYFPSITIKNILNTITSDVLEHDGTFKSTIEHCNFIKNYYNKNSHEHLYLIIHNIDGTMLRPSTAQTILSLLAQSPSIHLIASIDHIHAPLIWDQIQNGRFNWLWYDVTTFEPYTEETSYENSLLVQQSGSLALSSLIHVFRSLTANAKGVFMLIANYQLEHSKEVNYHGLSFHDCYTKSREAFLVNSDATLRAQLTEFRDHKLIKSKKGSDGVEYLLIPLEDPTLKQFMEDQES